jgi:hypothetical protein
VVKPTNQLVPSSLATNPIPTNVNLNIRVRAQFGVTFGNFGPACRVRFIPNNSAFAGETRELIVEDGVSNVSMTLFPNPNRDRVVTVTINGLLTEGNAQIEIYDAMGQRVHAERAAIAEGLLNTTMVLGNDLGAGMYVVNVTAIPRKGGDGERFTQRLVIE